MSHPVETPRHVDDPPTLLLWRIDDLVPVVLMLGILPDQLPGLPSTRHRPGAPLRALPPQPSRRLRVALGLLGGDAWLSRADHAQSLHPPVAAVTLADFLANWRGLTLENRLHRMAVLGLIGTNLITAVALLRADHTVVLVPPVLEGQVSVARESASQEVKEAWALLAPALRRLESHMDQLAVSLEKLGLGKGVDPERGALIEGLRRENAKQLEELRRERRRIPPSIAAAERHEIGNHSAMKIIALRPIAAILVVLGVGLPAVASETAAAPASARAPGKRP